MTQQDKQQLLTPVGRMVQGHPFEEQTKDMAGKPLMTKDGKPRVKYFIAIAIPKTDPAWPAFWAEIYNKGAASWPGGQYKLPTFAWKVADGDAHPDKEGFAGHWIVKASGSFAPRVYTRGGTGLITEKTGIKRGDYVRIYLSIVSNQDGSKPGLYLNPQMVELIGYGQEIQGGPDGAQVFGGAPVTALPPGASATPVAPTTAIAPPGGAPAAAAPPLPGGPAAPAAGNPPAPPGGPTAATSVVTPAADILGGPPAAAAPASPAAPAAPAPAPAPRVPVKTMTAKAGGVPYESFVAQKWTDEALVQHGYMTIQ